MIAAVKRRLADDRGTSVLELVIASLLFFILLLATLSILDSGTKSERGSQARDAALTEIRQAMTRISKDVRQTLSVSSSSTPSLLDIQTLISGSQHHVVFVVTSGKLTRTVDGGSPYPLLSGVTASSSAPFCYDPPNCALTLDTHSIRIDIQVQADQSQAAPITLSTELQLRNM